MLPPDVQARIEKSAAAAPPYTEAQKEMIRRLFGAAAARQADG